MIVKKIKTQKYIKPKAWQIADLVDYIRHMKSKNPDEKVTYTGHRGFFSDTHTAQKLEMIALASESIQSKMPVTHWLFSWRENEQPCAKHVEEIADIFLEHMGLKGHQVIYALHHDTNNYHLHLAINRTHPVTHKVLQPHKGFDINAAHKMLAQIEQKQGWISEKSPRYAVLEDGQVTRVLKKNKPCPKPKAIDFERATGEKSAQRIAQERGLQVIVNAKSWYEIHEKLAQEHMRFEKKGSGAIVWVGDTAIKASSIHRDCSMKKLCAKLGDFVPYDALRGSGKEREEVSIPSEPVFTINLPEWQKYQSEKAVFLTRTAQNSMRAMYKKRLFEAKQEYQKEQKAVLPRMAKHGLSLLNIARHAMKKQHEERLYRLRNSMPQKQKFPSFEEWLLNRGQAKQAHLWRYRLRLEQSQKSEPSSPKLDKPQPLVKSSELTAFEQYAHAVNADRYRVTCIKMGQGNTKKVFILGRKNGVAQGFTLEEMQKTMPEIQRIQKRGENIYYTPLSDRKHHILIDDITAQSLEQLQKDGFSPAVILESSPHNYQCVLTIPKFKSPFNRDVGNRLTEQLNKYYGDKKLSGCIHPHRAPAFENRKPKHRKADGSFPMVQLLYAEQKICSKAWEISKELAHEYAEKEKQRKTQPPPTYTSLNFPQGSTIQAYYAHWQNINTHIHVLDFSRVDAMIALRLRATGHSLEDVMHTLETCAPTIREAEQRRNWPDYAQRTARYAFGVAGDFDLQKNGKYVGHWQRIEQGKEVQHMKNLVRLR